MASTLAELLALLPDNTTGAIDAVDLRTIVTELYNRGDELEARLLVVEEATNALQESVTTLTDKAELLDDRMDVLEERVESNSNSFDQVFSYVWSTTTAPGTGRVHVDSWSMAATMIQMNETTDNGQTLTFTLMGNATSVEIWLLGANGKSLHANVTGPAVDQGVYRDVPITPIAVIGTAPAQSEKTSVAVIGRMP